MGQAQDPGVVVVGNRQADIGAQTGGQIVRQAGPDHPGMDSGGKNREQAPAVDCIGNTGFEAQHEAALGQGSGHDQYPGGTKARAGLYSDERMMADGGVRNPLAAHQ